jgi:hypothetical protein
VEGGELMSQTYAILSKDTVKTLYRALNDSVAAGNLYEDEKEEIQDALDKILYNGTTRKWFQVIDYNDPSFATCYDRARYDHYGVYPISETNTYPHPHTIGYSE